MNYLFFKPHFRIFKNLQATKTFLTFTVFLCTFSLLAQQQDTTKINTIDEVLVSAIRVTAKTPVSFSNLSKKSIETRNLGQDIPIIMNFLPSVVTTSDAGNGVGYTGIRVRGSDATRVNVTINGIPYNDSESSGTYFVNMPDFASSLESIQLQRGVGTSTNGGSAFGASLNMLTDSYSKTSSGEIANSVGSFSTRKHTVKFSTGLLNDHFELAGRVSKIVSNGYIDRASSDLKSYFLQGTYVGKTTLIKALAFGGTEKTYQAYYGVDAETLKTNRTFNPIGIYTDSFGNTRYYENETDNYQQDHYQLHWSEKISSTWNTNFALHYTKGKGYFENYKEDDLLQNYNLPNVVIGGVIIENSDLIRQKWLDNDFFGTTFSTNYKTKNIDFIFGGAINRYLGNHFGKVIWARFASTSEINDKYYDNDAKKDDANFFAKVNYQLSDKLSFYGDLQYRNIHYKADSPETGVVNDTFRFLNPKAGFNFTLNKKNNLYFSYAKAHREPNRTDYENGNPKPEKLDDFELGWRFTAPKTQININGYLMNYKNQLVLTGAIDDVGSPIRANVGDSYRLGFEVDATFKASDKLYIKPNFTVSQNKNTNFVFERDGVLQNLGSTNIAFSPDVIAANQVVFVPNKNFQIALLTKYVGEQYMGNIDAKSSKLESYFTSDINLSYEIKPKSVFKSIVFSGIVTNVFDVLYVSNGYFFTYNDDFSVPGTSTTVEGAGFYPQAGIHFLVGMNLKF